LWFLGAPAWLIDVFLLNKLRTFFLKRLMAQWRPDVIHAIEMQNAGYLLLGCSKTLDSLEARPRVIVTNFGSDIFWFSRFPKHRDKIGRLLQLANDYSCECHRDVTLAKKLGFTGRVMPVFPNSGGFSSKDLNRPLSAATERTAIAIKGYQGWVGRANIALDAVQLLEEELKRYEIVVYSCNRATIRRAKRLKRETRLDVTYLAKGQLSHRQMMDLFGRSRIYIGISESDGISTSLLEAMACGAIPVQTSTSCYDEWVKDTGVRVDAISPAAVAEAISAALELAKDPLNSETNRNTVAERAGEEKVKSASMRFYR